MNPRPHPALLERGLSSYKDVYLNNNHSNNGCHFNGSTELAFELQKQQLIIELKDKELAMKDREIENLKEILALLKRLPSEQPA
ncbi:MAG: hypothetical protein WAO71_05070 [Gallionella sp.]